MGVKQPKIYDGTFSRVILAIGFSSKNYFVDVQVSSKYLSE